MNKNEWISPLIVIGLTGVFAFVSLCVYLNRGRSRYWMAKKMKIGAVLIMFSSLANQSCEPFVTTCYDPIPPNNISLDDAIGDVLELNLKNTNIITGVLYNRSGNSYSFSVKDTIETDTIVANIIQTGAINPVDGKFDSPTEEISFNLNSDLASETYYLHLYDTLATSQEYPISIYELKVTNED